MKNISEFRNEEGLSWQITKIRHVLKNKIETPIREHNITYEQWTVLSRISRMEGYNQKQLAEASVRNGATITRLLNSLENKNLIERKKSPNDKREYLIYLTDNGKKTCKDVEKIIFNYNNDLESIFTNSEIKNLNKSLDKLLNYIK